MTDKNHDVTSDPAHDGGTAGDWSDEGGALPQGPAPDPEASEPDEVSLAEADRPEDR